MPTTWPRLRRCFVTSWRSELRPVLSAARASCAGSDEAGAIAEKRRPSWMPKPVVFPLVWISIAVRIAVGIIGHRCCGRSCGRCQL